MAQDAYVLGAWQSDFAAPAGDGGIYGLLEAATLGVLHVAGVEPGSIGVAHVGNMAAELTCFQGQLGGLVAAIHPAFNALPTSRHEAACASGSMATLAATADLEAGRYDMALVIGIEILRNVSAGEAGRLTSCAMWTGHEAEGERFAFPYLFSQLADEYDRRYGLDAAHLAHIGHVNRANAARNPLALARADVLAKDYFSPDPTRNPPIGSKLNRRDCCWAADGAAALVLATPDAAAAHAARHRIDLSSIPRIEGWGHATAPMAVSHKLELAKDQAYVLPHANKAMNDCLRRGGVSGPDALDVIELHDCFTFSELILLDHLGLVPPGKVGQLVEQGIFDPGGTLPVNPSGGLLGGGHPAGATGVRMLVDAVKQVSGSAGEYQVENARRALTINFGGSFTTVASFLVGSGS